MDSPAPRRGEVWRVSLDPAIGAEIKKTRPAVVLSRDAVGRLPLKLVAPLTEWKGDFQNSFWLVRVDPDDANGLSKPSATDALQLRCVDTRRFVEKLGELSVPVMDDIARAVVAVISFRP